MRTKTPSFITELPLKTTSVHESTILVRLDTGRQLYNACIGEALNRLGLIQQSKNFQEIQKLPKTINGELNIERTVAFKQLNQKYGTVKKGSKKWIKSNRYKATSNELAETDRKLVACRKSLHGKDINEIIAMGTRIQTEDISYKAWQKMFGKSIQIRAPSMFMSSLKRKAENAGGYIREFPTQTTKLSQICHICGEAVKKPLSQRWHVCCEIEMQRDLYSAFLAKCIDIRTSSLDIARAQLLWQGLEPVLSEAVSRAYKTAISGRNPASFGFNRIQSQSSSLVKPATIVSEAMDVVVQMDESHRELI